MKLYEVGSELLDKLLGVQHTSGGRLDVLDKVGLEVRLGFALEDGPLDAADELQFNSR